MKAYSVKAMTVEQIMADKERVAKRLYPDDWTTAVQRFTYQELVALEVASHPPLFDEDCSGDVMIDEEPSKVHQELYGIIIEDDPTVNGECWCWSALSCREFFTSLAEGAALWRERRKHTAIFRRTAEVAKVAFQHQAHFSEGITVFCTDDPDFVWIGYSGQIWKMDITDMDRMAVFSQFLDHPRLQYDHKVHGPVTPMTFDRMESVKPEIMVFETSDEGFMRGAVRVLEAAYRLATAPGPSLEHAAAKKAMTDLQLKPLPLERIGEGWSNPWMQFRHLNNFFEAVVVAKAFQGEVHGRRAGIPQGPFPSFRMAVISHENIPVWFYYDAGDGKVLPIAAGSFCEIIRDHFPQE